MSHSAKPRLRIVFAGTPEFAVPSLETLLAHPAVDLISVYTQPDRPAGRGRQARFSAVKVAAQAAGVPVAQPTNFDDAGACERLRALAPDLLVVAAYGLILPEPVLGVPAIAPINVHASLLPRWRGAAPVHRAIMAGDNETGISIMRMVKALDAGPVWLSRSCAIGPTDTAGALHDRLAVLGGECLGRAIAQLLVGQVVERSQNTEGVTYAGKLTPTDRRLNWSEPALDIERRIRGLNPSPVALARLAELELKIWAAVPSPEHHDAAPGAVLGIDANGITVATGRGTLRITELQPPGKRRMDAREFLNGYGQFLR